MARFTQEIHTTFGETARERAKYLYDLFCEHVQKFNPRCYLDVGTGLGHNAIVFGQNSDEILVIEVELPKNRNILNDHRNVSIIVADAQSLPSKAKQFDMVSLFSVLEHVTKQELALREALRILKPEGKLIIQVPNRFFPLELHSGLPFVFLIPSSLKPFVLRRLGCEWLNDVEIPSRNRLEDMISKIAPSAKITVKKIIYPPMLVASRLQSLYSFVQKLRILRFIPLGYLFIVEK